MCPLLIATAQSNLPIVRLCVQRPLVNLNITNIDGKTALFLAIEKGDTEILDTLLSEDVVERLTIDQRDVNRISILTMICYCLCCDRS